VPTDAAVPLRKCIATVALSGTLRDKLEACAAVGFDGVEIMEADLLTFEGSPTDVRHICEDLGLRIEIYQQHAPLRRSERCCEIHGRRRFSDPALLVRDRNDPLHGRQCTAAHAASQKLRLHRP